MPPNIPIAPMELPITRRFILKTSRFFWLQFSKATMSAGACWDSVTAPWHVRKMAVTHVTELAI